MTSNAITEAQLREQATHHFNNTRPPLEILPKEGTFHGAAAQGKMNENQRAVLTAMSHGYFNIYEYETELGLANLRNIIRHLVGRGFAELSHHGKIEGCIAAVNFYKITKEGKGQI
jgi:hypothetical protein